MPRRIDLAQRRAELAAAVWTTIREHGIGAVSIRAVAASAGLSVGSLRHVFPTRAELLEFSAELMLQRATERILGSPLTGVPEDDAVVLLAHLLPFEEESRVELEVNIALIAEAPALPSLAPLRDDTHRSIAGMCERLVGMLAPSADQARVSHEARRLHALIDGAALHLLADPGRADWTRTLLREEVRRIAREAPRQPLPH